MSLSSQPLQHKQKWLWLSLLPKKETEAQKWSVNCPADKQELLIWF